ncbi:sonic hedgehog protein-like [Mustelus asterias]
MQGLGSSLLQCQLSFDSVGRGKELSVITDSQGNLENVPEEAISCSYHDAGNYQSKVDSGTSECQWRSTESLLHLQELEWTHYNILFDPLAIFKGYGQQADNSLATKTGGCFPSKAMVTLENGQTRAVSQLNPGDRVLTVDAAGKVVPSQVLLFLDKEEELRISFTVLETEDPQQRLELTAAHLVFVSDNNTDKMENFRPMFASRMRTGQFILVREVGSGRLRSSKIKAIYAEEDIGAYAPLTSHGTLLVNNVLASCYAVIEKHHWAHLAFAPLRLFHSLTSLLPALHSRYGNATQENGIHWYSRFLYSLGKKVLDREKFHSL